MKMSRVPTWRAKAISCVTTIIVMQALAEEGMTMIVVTHEMAFARQVGTRLIFMEDGKISVDGNPAALLANPENPRLREFLQHVH